MKLGIIRLYVGESGKLGYYNIQELGLAKELVKYNIEVDIFILVDKNKQLQTEIIEIQKNIKIVYIPVLKIGTHGIINPDFLKKFNINILQISCDIQINTRRIINWCINNNIRVYTYVGTISSDSNKFIKKILTRIIVSNNLFAMKKVINVAKTPTVYDDLIIKGIKNARIIPVGLDCENFENVGDMDKMSLREIYRIDKYRKVIIFIGRLEEYKKPMFLPEILKKLVEGDNSYQLLVVGEGSLKNKLIKKIEEYKLINNFIFMGNIPNTEINKLYRLSDVVINLNDKEIYGMNILESMYCGCPVVAKKSPGACFIIDDMKNGAIVNSYNLDEWSNKIVYALDNSNRLSKDAIKKINEILTWKVIAKKFIRLYDDLK